MLKQSFLTALFTILMGVAAIYLIPWDKIPFRNPLFNKSTITVTGEAQGEEKNQIATYNVTVQTANDDKDTATNDVNAKMTAIINSLKQMGVLDDDIKTQNASVYENGDTRYPTYIYPRGVPTGKWVASNSIMITLRDLTRASSISDILNKSGATNVNGPNYQTDNTNNTQVDVLAKAIENARSKAEKLATASGRRLGKVVTINEGGQYGGIVPLMDKTTVGLGAGSTVPTPVQPGTNTVYKSVTVTFEIN